MAKEATETQKAEAGANQGLEHTQAEEISRQNQGAVPGRVAQRPASDSGNGVLDGFALPKISLAWNGNQITDCSTEACIVNGKQYSDSTKIPGNQPKPLLHPDGKPVIGPDGNPIIGPDRIDLEKIAQEAKSLSTFTAVANFRHAGEWDFQRMMTDDVPGVGARPIFTKDYQNFANVAIGYILGAKGMSFDALSSYANRYCQFKCSYDEPMSKDYPYLAARQVKDFEIGYKLYQERHPEAKK
ncbi:MAG TPA: hypothetical protein V6C89_04560 [Drouetiella sp.]